MFASNMKILTLNTQNTSPTTNVGVGGSTITTKELNNSAGGNDGGGNNGSIHKSNKREPNQKHSKPKFINGNSNKIQQHISQQQQQQQKFHQHNNNSNNNNNSNKSKKQHYNNNSTSSLNRKKYYQQQQQQQHYHHQQQQTHQQQQQYLNTLQHTLPSTTTNTTTGNNISNNTNNNKNLVKNPNYTNNIDLLLQQQNNNTNTVSSKNSNNKLDLPCTCLEQNGCDKLCLSSSSSVSKADYQYSPQQQQKLSNIVYDTHLKPSGKTTSASSLTSCNTTKISLLTTSSNTNTKDSTAASSRINCLSDLQQSQQQQSSIVNLKSSICNSKLSSIATSATKTTELVGSAVTAALGVVTNKGNSSQTSNSSGASSSSALSSSSHSQSTSTTSSKKKFSWKISNSSGGSNAATNCSGQSDCSSSNTIQSPKLSPQKLHTTETHLVTNSGNNNSKSSLNNNNGISCYSSSQNYSTTAATANTSQQKQLNNKQQVDVVHKSAMTTALPAGETTTVKTTASITNNNSTTSSSSSTIKSFPTSSTPQDKFKQNESKQVKISTNNNSNCSDISNTNSSGTETARNTSSTSSSSASAPSSPNSYSLDFLHSVGVQMSGVATRPSKVTAGTTSLYGNHSTVNSPARNSYPQTGMTSNHRQHQRYIYGGNNGGGGSHHYNQHHQPYHHHHQPSQLTIASFLQKDLLGETLLSSSKTTTGHSGNGGGVRNTSNNYNNQSHYSTHQQHPRYNHNYYPPQHLQHLHYGGYGGEYSRLASNGGGNNQRSAYGGYTNYHNTGGASGGSNNNLVVQQQQIRHSQNNTGGVVNSTNFTTSNVTSKKSSYVSSSASSCSSSSTTSVSSSSSANLHRQTQQQQSSTSQDTGTMSNLNLAIETLPSKSSQIQGGNGNQRGNHRGHHHNNHYHNHHGHNHYHPHSIANSPNTPQHQNYSNLTYVSTDGSISAATSRGCSPQPTQSLPTTPSSITTNSHSPKLLDNSPGPVAMLMNFNTNNHLQYQRFTNQQHLAAHQHHHQQQQQFYQYQQQHQNFLNKKLLAPLTITMPSPSPSPTPPTNTATVSIQQPPPGPHNIICCSQLDEATTAAAAAAASSSSSSGIVAGNDYDSDTSSNHSSTQHKYQSLKSMQSLSSSSSSALSKSASTTSLSLTGGQACGQQDCSQPTTPAIIGTATTTPLHSPMEYNYAPSVGSNTFPNLQVAQIAQQHLYNPGNVASQQLPQIYHNGNVISLLNRPIQTANMTGHSNNPDDDYQQINTQQPPPHHFYFNSSPTTGDHLNVASALTAVTNSCSANSSGYWSPIHHATFLFQPTSTASGPIALIPPPSTTISSCGSSSASISPRNCEELQIQLHQQQLQKNSCISSAASSPSSSCFNEQFGHIIVGSSNGDDSNVVGPEGGGGGSCKSSTSNSSVSGSTSEKSGGINITGGEEEQNYKRGSSQLTTQQQHRLIGQQQAPSSTLSSASTLTSAARARSDVGVESGTNNDRIHQIQGSVNSSSNTAVVGIVSGTGPQQLSQPPPYIYSHQQQQTLPTPLPPNNLLYNPQAHHMRVLNSSINSDYFTHTPIDRYLARAHLVEAKDVPPDLLNNSKWDHLSQAIWNKFTNSQQTEETFKQKMRLWRYLYLFVKHAYPRYGLYLVGSTISGFGADSSDVDMCLVSRNASSLDPRLEALFNLTILRDSLSKCGEFKSFNLIEAKVPILRFRDRIHQLEIDLNFNNCVGIKNTHLLYCYSQLDWRLRPLVLVIKLWAQYHDINDAKNMTISSYSLVLMVIHFLQYGVNPSVLPCLHDMFPDKFPLLRSNDFGYVDLNETIDAYCSKNTQSIGELFFYFLQYYSCFDYAQFAISVRTGGLLPINVCRNAKSLKNDIHQWKVLCIEEPFDLTNTARSVYDYETFERVKAVFVSSWRILKETLDLNSVFSPIVPSSSPPSQSQLCSISTATNALTTTTVNIKTSSNDSFDQSVMTKLLIREFTTISAASEYYAEKPQVVKKDSSTDNKDSRNNTSVVKEQKFIKNKESIAHPRSREIKKNGAIVEKEVHKVSQTPISSSPAPSLSSSCMKNSTKMIINRNNNNKANATALIS